MENKITKLLAASVVSLLSFNVYAIPVLQIGPDALDSSASYVGGGDDTWYLSNDGSSFSFNAYNTGTYGQTAYLVFAATPKLIDPNINYFDVNVSDGDNVLTMVESGVGTPPVLDTNSIAPHDIFETFYKVFELNFDGPLTQIGNTEPGSGTGTTAGYSENISVLFNVLNADVTGIHVDMFTIDGAWTAAVEDKKLVTAFAPFSHDAQTTVVPVPAAAWLFASGLIGLVGVARRK